MKPMHHKRKPKSTKQRVFIMAKVVAPPIKDPGIKFKGEILNGVLDPLDNLPLALKEIGNNNGA